MKSLLVLLFVFVNLLSISAQSSRYDSLILAGINQIYNVEFSNAEKTFSVVTKNYPNIPSGKFFDAMIVWWKIMLDMENESYDDILYDKLEDVIDDCDKILDKNENNSDALFFKGGSLGFRGRLLAYRESWLKAALDGKDALPLINEAYKKNPNNVDVQLGFGIYNYYVDIFPKKYPVVKPILSIFPKGNKEKGLKQLNYVADKGKYASIETKYFLCSIYFQYEKNYDEALRIVSELTSRFPANPSFQKYKGRILVARKEYTEARALFNTTLNRCSSGLIGYNKGVKREANYYLGFMEYITNNYTGAIPYLETSKNLSMQIDKRKDTNYKINTILYLGMSYDATGNRQKAIEQYKLLLDLDDISGSHKQANKYLKSAYKQ